MRAMVAVQASFEAESFDDSNNLIEKRQPITGDILKSWNEAGNSGGESGNPKTAFIHIYGNISAIQQHSHSRLVLVDTPGPNNSQNEEHGKKTYQAINDKQLPMILYVLNATQIGITDDSHLLAAIKGSMSKAVSKQARDRVIFLINKFDEIDPENESIESLISNTKKYLGIENPIILPVSARATLLIRKNKNNTDLSKSEKRYLDNAIEQFTDDEHSLLKYMSLSPSVTKQVNEKLNAAGKDEKEIASIHSGIPVLECVIDEYLKKYALPNKIYSVYTLIEKIIDMFKKEQDVQLKLIGSSQAEMANIKKEIGMIERKRKDGESFKQFKTETLSKPIEIPPETYSQIAAVETSGRTEITKIGNQFSSGEMLQKEADKLLKKADRLYAECRPEILVLLEEKRSEYLEQLNQQLLQAYQGYVAGLFEHSDHSSLLGAIEDLKIAALTLSASKNLINSNTSSREEVVGTYEVSTSKWYNPFSWGDTETRNRYETKEYTNIKNVWDFRRTELTKDLGELKSNILQDIKQQATNLRAHFLDNAEKKLEPELEKMLAKMSELSNQKEGKEKEIKKIQGKLDAITQFEQQAQQILQLRSQFMPYKPNALLQEYITRKDVASLPYALLTYLGKNELPDDEALKAAQWCQEQLPDAFQETKASIPFPKDSETSNWTSDYYFHHISYAESNFSMERFEHLVEVRNHLRTQGHELFQRIEKTAATEPVQNVTGANAKKNPPPMGVLLLGAGILIVVAVLLW